METIGIAAAAILIATEIFAVSEAVLWSGATYLKLGSVGVEATFAISGLLAIAGGVWIARSALAHRGE